MIQLSLAGYPLAVTPVSEQDCHLILDTWGSAYSEEARRSRERPKSMLDPLILALLSVNAPFHATIAAFKALDEVDLLNKWEVGRLLRHTAARDGVVSYPWTKASWIGDLALSVVEDGLSLWPFPADVDFRAYLRKNVKGLGWAKASYATMLALGSADVCCVDTHIYRLFSGHPLGKSLSKKAYLELEHRIRCLARVHGLATSVAQHCLWDAMRGERTPLYPC